MPNVRQRAAAKRDLVEHFVYLAACRTFIEITRHSGHAI